MGDGTIPDSVCLPVVVACEGLWASRRATTWSGGQTLLGYRRDRPRQSAIRCSDGPAQPYWMCSPPGKDETNVKRCVACRCYDERRDRLG